MSAQPSNETEQHLSSQTQATALLLLLLPLLLQLLLLLLLLLLSSSGHLAGRAFSGIWDRDEHGRHRGKMPHVVVVSAL